MHKFWWHEKSRGTRIHSLLRTIPALSKTRIKRSSGRSSRSRIPIPILSSEDEVNTTPDAKLQHEHQLLHSTQDVAAVKTKRKPEKRTAASSSSSRLLPPSLASIKQLIPHVDPEFFIGITPQTIMSKPTKSHANNADNNKKPSETETTITKHTRFVPPSLASFLQLLPHVDPEFFIGTTPQTVLSKTRTQANNTNNKKPSKTKTTVAKQKKILDLREGMTEALEELRTMRREMEEMRKELAKIKQLQMGEDYELDEELDEQQQQQLEQQKKMVLAHRRHEYEKLAAEVERWAEDILFPHNSHSDEEQDTSWTEVQCNKMLKSKYNPDGRTRAYIKWMKDSRGRSDITRQKTEHTFDENQEWPIIRMYSTIDAPVDQVSLYLSQADHLTDYNQLIEDHKDLEEITPHSKICWGQTPQVLFIKSRDFVTFCHHRWRRDGTQVVVNQACDAHRDLHANAHALRGATFIGPDPDDPEGRTCIAMLTHASPGQDVPMWACKTALQSLAPIEPFRLFYKVNEGVKQSRDELQADSRRLREAELVGSNSTGDRHHHHHHHSTMSRRPAGLAQMGYACFWPHGGGEIEAGVAGVPAEQQEQLPLLGSSSSSLSEDSVSGVPVKPSLATEPQQRQQQEEAEEAIAQ